MYPERMKHVLTVGGLAALLLASGAAAATGVISPVAIPTASGPDICINSHDPGPPHGVISPVALPLEACAHDRSPHGVISRVGLPPKIHGDRDILTIQRHHP